MKMYQRVAEIERICGHTFQDKSLIESAITHPSAVEGKPVSASYERLEFLGDSILGAIVATDLFERFPAMSGGEKSLTALALLFAVYKARTVPFYVFDEVEAALDDANLSKLLDAIEQLKESTQLIVISHQRRTMEQADVLYGVSMPNTATPAR